MSDVTFDAIAFNGPTALALDEDGRLWAWGSPQVTLDGVSDTDTDNVVEPTLVDTSLRFNQLLEDNGTVSAIRTNGRSYTWYGSGDSYYPISDMADPVAPDDVVFAASGYAITEKGDLLEINEDFDGWIDLGWPPVDSLLPPSATCLNLS